MTDVRYVMTRSKLSKEIGRGKGQMVAESLKAAQRGLQDLRAVCETALDIEIRAIVAEFGADADRSNPSAQNLYRRASAILDVIAAVPGTGLEGAISSLCHLADQFESVGFWDWQAVDIHLSVIAILRSRGGGLGRAQINKIVEGLLRLTAYKAAMVRSGCEGDE